MPGARAVYRCVVTAVAAGAADSSARLMCGAGAALLSRSSSGSKRPRVRYEIPENSNGARAAAATTAPEILKYKLFERMRNRPTSKASTV